MANDTDTPPYDARAVANFFLDLAKEASAGPTCVVLIKMIYFAHGHHLARYDEPLINTVFEAWDRGPVVRCVYNSFKVMGSRPIEEMRAHALNTWTAELQEVPACNPDQERRSLLEAVFKKYFGHTDSQISALTHVKGSPWHEVYHAARVSTDGMSISDCNIRNYFKNDGQKAKQFSSSVH